jgi:transcriptional regulator with XRE-family HTH domain
MTRLTEKEYYAWLRMHCKGAVGIKPLSKEWKERIESKEKYGPYKTKWLCRNTRRFRKEKGWSTEKLAKKIGVVPELIEDLENGWLTGVLMSDTVELAHVFNIDFLELVAPPSYIAKLNKKKNKKIIFQYWIPALATKCPDMFFDTLFKKSIFNHSKQ